GEALIVVPRDPNSDPALSDRHGGAELDVARTEGAGRQLTLIFQGPSATCPLEDVGGPKVLEQGEVVGKGGAHHDLVSVDRHGRAKFVEGPGIVGQELRRLAPGSRGCRRQFEDIGRARQTPTARVAGGADDQGRAVERDGEAEQGAARGVRGLQLGRLNPLRSAGLGNELKEVDHSGVLDLPISHGSAGRQPAAADRDRGPELVAQLEIGRPELRSCRSRSRLGIQVQGYGTRIRVVLIGAGREPISTRAERPPEMGVLCGSRCEQQRRIAIDRNGRGEEARQPEPRDGGGNHQEDRTSFVSHWGGLGGPVVKSRSWNGGSPRMFKSSKPWVGAGRVGSPPGGITTHWPASTSTGSPPALAWTLTTPSSTATNVPTRGSTRKRASVPLTPAAASGVSTSMGGSPGRRARKNRPRLNRTLGSQEREESPSSASLGPRIFSTPLTLRPSRVIRLQPNARLKSTLRKASRPSSFTFMPRVMGFLAARSRAGSPGGKAWTAGLTTAAMPISSAATPVPRSPIPRTAMFAMAAARITAPSSGQRRSPSAGSRDPGAHPPDRHLNSAGCRPPGASSAAGPRPPRRASPPTARSCRAVAARLDR